MCSATTLNPNNILAPQFKKLIPYFLLILAVAIAYSNTYNNALLYDDVYLISQNQYLRDWHSFGAIFTHFVNGGAHRSGFFYRPLQNILYFFVYQLGGVTLFGFHLLNIALHAANACLVYALGR